jgi:hypothetical protein
VVSPETDMVEVPLDKLALGESLLLESINENIQIGKRMTMKMNKEPGNNHVVIIENSDDSQMDDFKLRHSLSSSSPESSDCEIEPLEKESDL